MTQQKYISKFTGPEIDKKLEKVAIFDKNPVELNIPTVANASGKTNITISTDGYYKVCNIPHTSTNFSSINFENCLMVIADSSLTDTSGIYGAAFVYDAKAGIYPFIEMESACAIDIYILLKNQIAYVIIRAEY